MLLREKDKQSLVNIFQSLNMPFEVWAYGSRVNGGAHSGSDLDLVIRTPDLSKMPYDTYISLCQTIRESNIPILVELRDWSMLPQSFHRNIEKEYEVLFSNLEIEP